MVNQLFNNIFFEEDIRSLLQVFVTVFEILNFRNSKQAKIFSKQKEFESVEYEHYAYDMIDFRMKSGYLFVTLLLPLTIPCNCCASLNAIVSSPEGPLRTVLCCWDIFTFYYFCQASITLLQFKYFVNNRSFHFLPTLVQTNLFEHVKARYNYRAKVNKYCG